MIGFFKDKKIKYVSAGQNHCAAVDLYGNTYAWGRNSHGQCGVVTSDPNAEIVSPPIVVNLQYTTQQQQLH